MVGYRQVWVARLLLGLRWRYEAAMMEAAIKDILDKLERDAELLWSGSIAVAVLGRAKAISTANWTLPSEPGLGLAQPRPPRD